MLAHPEDGYKYTECSGEKVEWICPNCGHIKTEKISNVKNKGLSCPICNDGISIPNKFMASFLEEVNETFETEFSFEGQTRRYDFYIPRLNMIIEMHGRQHYEEWKKSDKNLSERQKIDKEKKDYAIEQGIEYYLVINCRIQSYEHMTKEIKKSVLKGFYNFESIDWNHVYTNAMKSKVILAIDLHKKGYTTTEIGNKLHVTRSTINHWLIDADNIGIYEYNKSVGNRYDKKKVVLVNHNKIYDSAYKAGQQENISYKLINRCCAGKSKYAGTINGEPAVWRYLDQYNPNEKIRYDLLKINEGRGTAVSKYDENNNYIETYATIALALKSVNINSGHSISFAEALNNPNLTAYGFHWYKANDLNQPDKSKIYTA
jgi:predicted transcriptional regulator